MYSGPRPKTICRLRPWVTFLVVVAAVWAVPARAQPDPRKDCAACPLDGTPVCGREDGIEYPNLCIALCQGVVMTDAGPCTDATAPPPNSDASTLGVHPPPDSTPRGSITAAPYPLDRSLRLTVGSVTSQVMNAMARANFRYVGSYATVAGSPAPNAGINSADPTFISRTGDRGRLGVACKFPDGHVYMEAPNAPITVAANGSIPGWFPLAAPTAGPESVTPPTPVFAGTPPPGPDAADSSPPTKRRMRQLLSDMFQGELRLPSSRDTAREEQAAQRLRRMLGVIGPDSRVPEYNATAPFSAIYRIVFGVTGPRSACTAFLIHPSVLLTNGHCVYDSDGRYFYTASVYRVMQKLDPDPYAQPNVLPVRVKEVRTTQGWMFNRDFRYDLGLVFLDTRLGDTSGWFGVSFSCARTNYLFSLTGYPGDQASGTPYTSQCAVTHDTCSVSEMTHTCDTYAGQSGSPMYTDDDMVARAVHSCEMSGQPYNCGVMFRPDLWDFLLQVYTTTV